LLPAFPNSPISGIKSLVQLGRRAGAGSCVGSYYRMWETLEGEIVGLKCE